MKKLLFILCILCTIFFAKVICAPPAQVLSHPGDFNDIQEQYYSMRSFGFEKLSQGKLPLWNPYIYCGYPYLAEIQSAIFYPLNAFFFMHNIARAINWSFIVHIFLSGMGVLIFLKELRLSPAARLCGALSFAFSAPVICHITAGHLSNINTIAWIGFIFWALYRVYAKRQPAYALLCGVFLACQITAGHIQYFFYTCIAAGAYAAALFFKTWKDSGVRAATAYAGYLLLAGTLAAGLSAVQTAPVAEYMRLSSRHTLSYEFCSDFSFPIENMLTLAMPEFFGNSFTTVYAGRFYFWEMCAYAGIVALLLAALAVAGRGASPQKKHITFFCLLGAVTFILALGNQTPLFAFLYHWVPGFNLFRGNSKFIFLTDFSIAILAGIGAEGIVAPKKIASGMARRFATAGAALFAGALALFFLFRCNNYALWERVIAALQEQTMCNPPLNPHDPAIISQTFAQGLEQILRAAFLATGFCGVLLLRNRKARMYALIGLMLLDLWGFGSKYLIMQDSSRWKVNPQLVARLRSDPAPFRIVSPVLPANFGMTEKVENAEGYGSSVLADYHSFINASQGAALEKSRYEHNPFRISLLSKHIDLLNVRYVIVPKNVTITHDGAAYAPWYADQQYRIYRCPNALDRAFFVTDIQTLSHDKILETIGKSYFHPGKTALIEEQPPFAIDPDQAAAAHITIRKHEPEKILIDCENNTDGLLVVSDAYYPGWHVRVNGKREKIYKTDYFLRGVFLKAGTNTVEFSFTQQSVIIGGWISILTLVLCTAVGIVGMRNSIRQRIFLIRTQAPAPPATSASSPADKTKIIIAIAVLCAVTFITFYPSLKNGFTNCDDDKMVTTNHKITSLSWPTVKSFFTAPHEYLYHPLVLITYAVEYHFFNLQPLPYHVTNLAFHLGATALVFLFIVLLCRNIPVAFLTTLFFSIHPLRVESVAWITERKDVLSAFFYLGTLAAYTAYGRANKHTAWYYLALASFTLSLLAKPMAITLPFVLIIIDVFLGKTITSKTLREKTPFLALAIVFAAIALWVHYPAGGKVIQPEPFTAFHRPLIGTYSIVFYLKKMFAPVHLSCLYQFPAALLAAPARHLIPSLLVVTLLAALVIYSRTYTNKIIFGALFFLITIAPVLQIFQIGGKSTPADRFTYIPAIALCYLMAEFCVWTYHRMKNSPAGRTLLLAAITIIVGTLSILTWQRCQVWNNSVTIWTDVLNLYPDNLIGYINRGDGYREKGEIDNAIADYTQAITHDPSYVIAYNNRAAAYLTQGRPDLALADYTKAVSLDAGAAYIYYNRGNTYATMREYDKAIADYSRAITLQPLYPEAYHNRGSAYNDLGKNDQALADYTQAIRIAPGYAQAYFNRGNVLVKNGAWDKALADYDQTLALDPHFLPANLGRARVYAQKGEYRKTWEEIAQIEKQGYTVDPGFIEELEKASPRTPPN